MEGSSVRSRAATSIQALLPSLTVDATRLLGHAEAVAFLARLETTLLDVFEPLEIVYGEVPLEGLVRSALAAAAERPAELRDLDRRRRSTGLGISAPGRSAMSATRTGSPGHFARWLTTWTIWMSSGSPICT
jgi:hypothetical protein